MDQGSSAVLRFQLDDQVKTVPYAAPTLSTPTMSQPRSFRNDPLGLTVINASCRSGRVIHAERCDLLATALAPLDEKFAKAYSEAGDGKQPKLDAIKEWEWACTLDEFLRVVILKGLEQKWFTKGDIQTRVTAKGGWDGLQAVLDSKTHPEWSPYL